MGLFGLGKKKAPMTISDDDIPAPSMTPSDSFSSNSEVPKMNDFSAPPMDIPPAPSDDLFATPPPLDSSQTNNLVTDTSNESTNTSAPPFPEPANSFSNNSDFSNSIPSPPEQLQNVGPSISQTTKTNTAPNANPLSQTNNSSEAPLTLTNLSDDENTSTMNEETTDFTADDSDTQPDLENFAKEEVDEGVDTSLASTDLGLSLSTSNNSDDLESNSNMGSTITENEDTSSALNSSDDSDFGLPDFSSDELEILGEESSPESPTNSSSFEDDLRSGEIELSELYVEKEHYKGLLRDLATIKLDLQKQVSELTRVSTISTRTGKVYESINDDLNEAHQKLLLVENIMFKD